jgi:PAS domain S-box-containing protein
MLVDDPEQRQAMLAAIIDSSEDAIISKDLSSRITSWNKSAERMFGYTEDEVVGKHIHILIPQERWSEEDMIISNLKAGKRIEHYQTIRVTKDGRQVHISLTVSPIRNAKGVIVGASKIARDITLQKHQEHLIREHLTRLEIINAVSKSISTKLEVEAILQKVTDATTSLSGAAFGAFFYNKTDSKGSAYMLYALSGVDKKAFENFPMPRNTKVFEATFTGAGIVRSPDITADPRYGQNFPHFGMPVGHLPVVSYLAVPVVSSSGVVIGGLFFGHPEKNMFGAEHEQLVASIAAQAAVALDNAKLYEEVNALSQKKDEFIGFASHELKTPLTTLSGYVQLAKRTNDLPPNFFDKIGKQVNRLERIIADLLDISKIQAGKLELTFGKTSLHALVQDSVDAVGSLERDIQVDLPEEDIAVVADYQKMSQVLINLISNAIKYSATNTVINVTGGRFGDNVEISVRDQGVGISPEYLDKIFHQFYRVARTSSTEGLGLGLYISREIIEGHSGKIWAESEEGKGSVFFISIPISRHGHSQGN